MKNAIEQTFILTTNEDSANALKQAGLKLINSKNNKFVFLNDFKNGVLLFNKLKDCAYTNTYFL